MLAEIVEWLSMIGYHRDRRLFGKGTRRRRPKPEAEKKKGRQGRRDGALLWAQ